jgi:hypothetical protein
MRATASRPRFAILTASLLAALVVTIQGAGATTSASAAGSCTKVSNIEAIIDDSGSMSISDSNRLRVQAMDLLINALDSGTTLGAIEFGSAEEFLTPPKPAADPIFNPEPVGPNAAAMKSALDATIQADNGATDYNAAFNTARSANPGAQARIFLTDGGHDEGVYANTHLNPTPPQTPTYVVGFSPGLSGAEDQARLKQIAADTGGRYFPLADSSGLQAVMDTIETILTCQTPPRTFEDKLAQGQKVTHSLAIGGSTSKVQIAMSWANAGDIFKIGGLRLIAHGQVAAVSRAHVHPRKLHVKRSTGKTFVVLKVSGLGKGQLRFQVRAAHVASGSKAVLTTQVSQASHR